MNYINNNQDDDDDETDPWKGFQPKFTALDLLNYHSSLITDSEVKITDLEKKLVASEYNISKLYENQEYLKNNLRVIVTAYNEQSNNIKDMSRKLRELDQDNQDLRQEVEVINEEIDNLYNQLQKGNGYEDNRS